MPLTNHPANDIEMAEALKSLPKATYLGDGVYARFDGYQTWIFTSNGVTISEPIALEPEVLKALNDYDKRSRDGER